jgi:hypothetical protein
MKDIDSDTGKSRGYLIMSNPQQDIMCASEFDITSKLTYREMSPGPNSHLMQLHLDLDGDDNITEIISVSSYYISQIRTIMEGIVSLIGGIEKMSMVTVIRLFSRNGTIANSIQNDIISNDTLSVADTVSCILHGNTTFSLMTISYLESDNENSSMKKLLSVRDILKLQKTTTTITNNSIQSMIQYTSAKNISGVHCNNGSILLAVYCKGNHMNLSGDFSPIVGYDDSTQSVFLMDMTKIEVIIISDYASYYT